MIIITSHTMFDHSILFRKLQDNVAHDAFLEILSSYLNVCTQNVKLDIVRSKMLSVSCGDPKARFWLRFCSNLYKRLSRNKTRIHCPCICRRYDIVLVEHRYQSAKIKLSFKINN